jgi:D-glycero-D-manno-heptose 1,7-bisphosphate phosphatase
MALGTKKAILADLDGVFFKLINHFGEYGVSARLPEEIKIVDGLGDTLDALAKLGFIIVGHTNQPDIARKNITPKFLDEKHALLVNKYPQIQKIFICSHTETDLCDCRKPKPGLLRQAAKEFGIDFSLSWVIGDSRGDIEAGKLVHAKTIFIQTDHNCGNPAIDIATAVTKNTKGALNLIKMLEEKTANIHDV